MRPLEGQLLVLVIVSYDPQYSASKSSKQNVLPRTQYCSRILPSYSSSQSKDTILVETHLTFSVSSSSSSCLVTSNGNLKAVLTIIHSNIIHPVLDQYNFTTPKPSISCYCQCSLSPCLLPECPLCYHLSHITPTCNTSQMVPSTTCCSVLLSTSGKIRTALRLGYPMTRIVYKLETVSDTGQLQKANHHTIFIGQRSTSVRHALSEGNMIIKFRH